MPDPTSRVDRAAALVYRFHGDRAHFLFVSTRKRRDRFVLPGGGVDPGETPEEAACRETLEESGVSAEVESLLGAYLHPKRTGRKLLTSLYLARMVEEGQPLENRGVLWLPIDQIDRPEVRIPRLVRQLIQLCHEELTEAAMS